MKPHIRLYYARWRCSGPRDNSQYQGVFYAFPWGYGDTPAEAYAAWRKLQKRPPTPKLPDVSNDTPSTAP